MDLFERIKLFEPVQIPIRVKKIKQPIQRNDVADHLFILIFNRKFVHSAYVKFPNVPRRLSLTNIDAKNFSFFEFISCHRIILVFR